MNFPAAAGLQCRGAAGGPDGTGLRATLSPFERMNASLRSVLPLLAGSLLAVTTTLRADSWTHWRGPNFDGSSPAKNLPATFSKTENVRWTADLPGPSAAVPAILGDRIFVSSTDTESQSLLALCLDR